MQGAEVKQIILDNGLMLWQVAKAYGVADTTFSKYLRGEFNEADTQKILSIVQELTKAKK